MIRNVVIVIILFSLLCCAHVYKFFNSEIDKKQCSLPVPIFIDNRLLQSQSNIVEKAVKFWNKVSNKQLLFSFGKQNINNLDDILYLVVTIYVSNGEEEEVLQHKCGIALIKYDGQGCILGAKIVLNSECQKTNEMLETVVRHELGHTLGLKDSLDNSGVMYYKILKAASHPIDANKEEIEELKSIYNLK